MAGKDTIVFTGLHETIKGLQEFDKGAVKKFNKVINDELRKGKLEAQQIIASSAVHGKEGAPLSGWSTNPDAEPKAGKIPSWSTGEAVAGVKASRAQGKANLRNGYTTSAGALINKSRQGAIFEVAGRKPGGGKNASGTAFKRVLTERFGGASRVVWKIVDRDRLKIQADFGRALEEAKATLQKALESQNTH